MKRNQTPPCPDRTKATGLVVEGLAAIACERAALLRTVHRLRCGLPPVEHLQDLTVAAEDLVSVLSTYLLVPGGHPRWFGLIGNYGEGKSLRLGLLRELALGCGFAVVSLSADATSSALNHPQRFLPLLMSTLELPHRSFRGYEQLLHEWLTDSRFTVTLRDIARRHLTRRSTLDVETLFFLSRLALIQTEASDKDNESGRLLRRIICHLTGESTMHRSADRGTRITSYTLLRLVTDLLASANIHGLVLLLDEIESIYTKLPNGRSRKGAYRVLAALCECSELVRCKVALAMTPDAYRHLVADIPVMLTEIESTAWEPVVDWAEALTDATRLHSCNSPVLGQRLELLERVRSFYCHTYGGADAAQTDCGWRTFIANYADVDVPLRVLVRLAVDFLDSERYRCTVHA